MNAYLMPKAFPAYAWGKPESLFLVVAERNETRSKENLPSGNSDRIHPVIAEAINILEYGAVAA